MSKIKTSGALRQRILDMGITPGTKIRMVKSAPMGDPIEISLHDYNLSIRKAEAGNIKLFESDKEAQMFLKSEEHTLKICERDSKVCAVSGNVQHFSENQKYKVALVGNPNSGKTTLFNNLTGSYQYVGNWPGVTVGQKEGHIKDINENIDLVDLPGVYSLSPYSPEEIITRNFIIEESPDAIINIVDATNLERNLYLTMQLLELDCPLLLVVNMTDLLAHRGKKIDYAYLSYALGVPVVAISAGKNKGVEELADRLSKFLKKPQINRVGYPLYSDEVEKALKNVKKIINPEQLCMCHSRFKTVKIFENDRLITREISCGAIQSEKIENIRKITAANLGKDKDVIIADERYSYISALCRRAVIKSQNAGKHSHSEAIDRILTGKYTAIPCFIAIILLIFYITFGPFGVMLKSWCETFINTNMVFTVERILNYLGASPGSKSLVLDAIIGGVGAVISFLPQVMLLFTLLSLLEDSGYMARAVFIMDKPFRKIGLSGKAFMPLIMGFGCSVPAIMGTRILENKKDKNLTVLLIPFMSCSAKMPIYLMFASMLFPHCQTRAILTLYLLGIIIAVVTAYIFSGRLKSGEESPFIMEIPGYKWPSFKNVGRSVWDRTRDFIERAGTVILIATVIVWFLQSFSADMRFVSDNSKSMLAKIGKLIAPAFSICGFGDWRACVSLLTGLMAKESVVSTLTILYGENISGAFTVCSGAAFMVFALLYTPCIAALSAMKREFGSWKLMAISVIYQLFIAFTMSALTYQIFSLALKCV